MLSSSKLYQQSFASIRTIGISAIATVLLFSGVDGLSAQRRSTSAPSKPVLFMPLCPNPSYPTPAPSKNPAIDSQCGLNGSGAGPEAAQNDAKNNFCATGTPQEITIAQMTDLQTQVEKNPAINFGNENQGTRKKGPTTNRAPLRKLGEGKLVTLRAFVLIARQEGGESVNCGPNVPNQSGFHDIHISLVVNAPTEDAVAGKVDPVQECAGVVAEMSPHHRPDSWNHGNVEKVAKARLPVRVTGHLYFDSSHFPCVNGKPSAGNPHRISLWEIHPVYKFEVCTADCNRAGTWLTLDEWAKQD